MRNGCCLGYISTVGMCKRCHEQLVTTNPTFQAINVITHGQQLHAQASIKCRRTAMVWGLFYVRGEVDMKVGSRTSTDLHPSNCLHIARRVTHPVLSSSSYLSTQIPAPASLPQYPFLSQVSFHRGRRATIEEALPE